jgi:hypothetical protein
MEAAERLVVIDVINADGIFLLQTQWEAATDGRRARRRTETESYTNREALQRRLNTLAAIMWSAACARLRGPQAGKVRLQ